MDTDIEEGQCEDQPWDGNFNNEDQRVVTLNVYNSSDEDNDDMYTIDEQSILRCGLGHPNSISKEQLSLRHTVLDLALTGMCTNDTLNNIKTILIENVDSHSINTLKLRYCENISKEGYNALNEMPFITQLIIEDDYCVSFLTISILKDNKYLKAIHFLNCSTIHDNVINMLYSMSKLTHLYFYFCSFVTYSRSMLDYYAMNKHIKVKIKDMPNLPHHSFIRTDDMEFIKMTLSN